MTQTIATLEQIQKINASFPFSDPVRDWKKLGKKVIGWTCINVPEEIIHAAGMLPFRFTGNSEELVLNKANAYLYTSTCSFIRSCFELGLRGEFDFLDALVASTPCEGTIRLAEVGEYYLKTPLICMLDVPRKIAERSYAFYRDELVAFKQQMEEYFNVKITDQALVESIRVYNETRALFRKLHELRKRDNPPVSGTEMMELMNAAVRMPRERFNLILNEFWNEINTTNRALPGQIRLMLSGSILNSSAFVKGVEDVGAIVVTDDLCTGSRYWWESVDTTNSDPLSALSRRYLNAQFPCPRLNPPTNRIRQILELAKDFRIEGVIALTMRNCAPYIHDLPLWKGKLEENGIPVLDLDIEYGSGVSGQIKTRVEAFIEMLSLGKEWE